MYLYVHSQASTVNDQGEKITESSSEPDTFSFPLSQPFDGAWSTLVGRVLGVEDRSCG